MKNKLWFEALLLMVVIPLLAVAAHAATDADIDKQAREIHSRVLAIDAHVDVLTPGTPERYWAPGHASRADLQKLESGGIGAVALAIAVGPGPRTDAGYAQARAEADSKLQLIRAFVKDNAQHVALALTADDVVRLHRQGKIAVIESFLNARSLGPDLTGIDQFYQSGVRIFGFTHAGNNAFADSSRPTEGEPPVEHQGLSPLGRQAVAKLNQLGVIIDVSQLTPAGVQQTLALSQAPVIASHSNARALLDNGRSLADAELDAIKQNGGVVHVTPFNAYLAAPNGPRASIKEYVDHIDYLVKRIGVDHVGIGSDFNHGSGITGKVRAT